MAPKHHCDGVWKLFGIVFEDYITTESLSLASKSVIQKPHPVD